MAGDSFIESRPLMIVIVAQVLTSKLYGLRQIAKACPPDQTILAGTHLFRILSFFSSDNADGKIAYERLGTSKPNQH